MTSLSTQEAFKYLESQHLSTYLGQVAGLLNFQEDKILKKDLDIAVYDLICFELTLKYF